MLRLVILLALIFVWTVCGSNTNRVGRIIGGEKAVENQFPYIASLRHKRLQDHICGASVINERWFVSAAHCTAQFTKDQLYLAVGLLRRSGGGFTHEIEEIINHDFDWNTLENE